MNSVIQLGPLALNGTVIVFVIAWSVSLALVRFYCERRQLNYQTIRRTVDGAILIGLISSRLVFVGLFFDVFQAKPWEILYFWQGGFNPWGGIVGAILFVVSKHLVLIKTIDLHHSFISFVTLILITLSFISGQWLMTRNQPSNESKPLVNFELTDMSDQPISLNQFKGKPLVLNFWATWCPPCRREMPLLEESYLAYQTEGIFIVTINVGEDSQTIRNYLHANNLTLPVLKSGVHNTNFVFDYFGGKVMPTTLFIDSDGNVQRLKIGELSAATLRQGIRDIRP
jgi:thiol-disulfide isomerase/thioredoxin